MKIAILLIMLVLSPTQAHETDSKPPYPEFAGDTFPIAHWELTMISHQDMWDITAEEYSRASCIKDGIRRMLRDMESVPVREWGADPLLGFICEYVDGSEEK